MWRYLVYVSWCLQLYLHLTTDRKIEENSAEYAHLVVQDGPR